MICGIDVCMALMFRDPRASLCLLWAPQVGQAVMGIVIHCGKRAIWLLRELKPYLTKYSLSQQIQVTVLWKCTAMPFFIGMDGNCCNHIAGTARTAVHWPGYPELQKVLLLA